MLSSLPTTPESMLRTAGKSIVRTTALARQHSGSPVATIIFNGAATKDEFIGYLKFMENATPRRPTLATVIGVSFGLFVLIIAVLVGGGYMHRRRRLKARQLEDYEIENELLGVSLLDSKPRPFTRRCTNTRVVSRTCLVVVVSAMSSEELWTMAYP